jgi:outer membrane lipoprotein-sorting protein
MRPTHATLALAATLLAAASVRAVAQNAGALEAALARMDATSAGFRGLTVDLQKVAYTAVINQKEVDEGTMAVKRPKPKDLRMLIDLKKPNPRTIAIQGGKVEMYFPKINTVQEYDAGKSRRLMEQFLLLGFGSTSADLKGAYHIKLLGEETVAGQKATQIELVPKSKEALAHLKRVELWLSDATGLPVRQRFHTGGGDYSEATYTNAKLAPNLPDAAVKLNLPKGVKRETPQK